MSRKTRHPCHVCGRGMPVHTKGKARVCSSVCRRGLADAIGYQRYLKRTARAG